MAERIDRERSRARIERDVETLAGPDYTLSDSAICRYAYTDEYRNTLAYFTAELERIGFAVWQDPVGTLIASNVAPDAAAFGVGSHCDSNRNGGKYDGTLGVCTALEVCRLAAEAGDGLPLRLISFLEEEGSGLRADAARLADHAPARHRGGAARVDPRRARRLVLGRPPRRPATSRRAGGSRSTRSTA